MEDLAHRIAPKKKLAGGPDQYDMYMYGFLPFASRVSPSLKNLRIENITSISYSMSE